jgi:putative ABC transport system ATP-binding protein
MLRATDLRYSASDEGESHVVLGGVDFEVSGGEIVDITGPSGSGKTTMLRALARLLPGVQGILALGDVQAEDIPPAQWRTHVTLLPQIAAMVPGTVGANLRFPWTLKVRKDEGAPSDTALRDALDGVGLHKIDLARDSAKLSVGQAARVALLRVTLTEPDVLLLDEPDASLDDDSAAQVTAMTRAFAERGGAIVRVRHLRSDELAARRYRLDHGVLEEVTQ